MLIPGQNRGENWSRRQCHFISLIPGTEASTVPYRTTFTITLVYFYKMFTVMVSLLRLNCPQVETGLRSRVPPSPPFVLSFPLVPIH